MGVAYRDRQTNWSTVIQSYIIVASDFSNGWRLNDRFINTFHQDPVTSRDTVHLNLVPVPNKLQTISLSTAPRHLQRSSITDTHTTATPITLLICHESQPDTTSQPASQPASQPLLTHILTKHWHYYSLSTIWIIQYKANNNLKGVRCSHRASVIHSRPTWPCLESSSSCSELRLVSYDSIRSSHRASVIHSRPTWPCLESSSSCSE